MYDPYDPISPNTLIPKSVYGPAKSNWTPWLLGCGCGCLMVIVFILFVLAVIYSKQLGLN